MGRVQGSGELLEGKLASEPAGHRDMLWHRLFQLGVVIKGIDGLLETGGGLLFLLVNQNTLMRLVFWLTRSELLEDPDDWLAAHLRAAFRHLSSRDEAFAAAYLLGHGLVKLGLVVGLWRDKLWAFPAALVVLLGFVGFQTYRLAEHMSIGLLCLTILDLLVIVLVWREYRRARFQRRQWPQR